MKTRLLFVPLLIAAVAALAACGGGGSKGVPSNAVAVVGSTPVTKTDFTSLMQQAIGQAISQGQPAPKLGTPQYTTLRDQVVNYLVQVSEIEQEAAKMGVKVTNGDVNAYIQSIQKLHYGNSRTKLLKAIKNSGLTLAEAKHTVLINLLETRLKNKVTAAVKVTTADEQKFYTTNKASFHQEKSRKVRHILVGSKSLALKLEKKLQNGASFAALAKKYSKDTTTGALGGKYTAVEGQDVPTFDKTAFSLKTHEISPPVKSPYGWHIIQALGPVIPAHTETFKQAQAQIKQQLLGQQQNTAWGTFLTNLQKKYAGKVSYQTGYTPASTATTTAPTGAATT